MKWVESDYDDDCVIIMPTMDVATYPCPKLVNLCR